MNFLGQFSKFEVELNIVYTSYTYFTKNDEAKVTPCELFNVTTIKTWYSELKNHLFILKTGEPNFRNELLALFAKEVCYDALLSYKYSVLYCKENPVQVGMWQKSVYYTGTKYVSSSLSFSIDVL